MHDVFYFTDIHGMYDLYRAIMNYCFTQDPECTVIFGGDAIDRGPDGYKIMKELLNNPKVVYLKGNHEDMFVRAALGLAKDYDWPRTEAYARDYLMECADYDTWVYNCICNGGMQTLIDWIVDGMPRSILNRLYNLPLTTQYEKLDFCHAGGDPKVYSRVSDNEYNEVLVDKEDVDMMLWDRNWLGFGWIPGKTLVYGHTPSFHLPAKYYGQDKSTFHAHPCKYIGMIDSRLTGYRISMDTGVVISGRAYVLNCTTMQAIGFRDMDFLDDTNPNHAIEQIEIIQL